MDEISVHLSTCFSMSLSQVPVPLFHPTNQLIQLFPLNQYRSIEIIFSDSIPNIALSVSVFLFLYLFHQTSPPFLSRFSSYLSLFISPYSYTLPVDHHLGFPRYLSALYRCMLICPRQYLVVRIIRIILRFRLNMQAKGSYQIMNYVSVTTFPW